MSVQATVKHDEATLALARAHLAAGRPLPAEQVLRQHVHAQPRAAEAWGLLAMIANTPQRADEAIACAERAVALDERCAEFHSSLGRALKTAGRFDEAVAAYERAIALRVEFADVYVSLGIVLRRLGRLDEAAARYREALQLRPGFPEALSNLGNVLAERLARSLGENLTAEDLREAEAVQRRALALAPRNADTLHNLAVVLKLTGRTDEAAALFNRSLAVDSHRPETCLQFGALLRDESRLDLARQLYSQWLADHPPDLRVMLALAECLQLLGESDDALAWLDRVETLEPGSAAVLHLRGRIEQQSFAMDIDADHALGLFRAAIDARPDYFEAVCSYLLSLCYREQDPIALRDEHRARIAPVIAAVPPLTEPLRSPRVPGRLRVGFMSHDFKRHSVAYFLEGMLQARDRSRHEFFAYKTNAGGDDVTQRLRRHLDHWIEAADFSDAQLAQRCRDDGIDVLVDLSGLTSGGRLGVFQRRAAPCQVAYLGYPTTIGADCIDFRLTDATIDPLGEPEAASERPIRLPASMFCYRPGDVPAVQSPPALRRGFVTFGSFNNFSKAGPTTLGLWCDVLAAVPQSRLRLKAGVFAKRGNRDHVVRHFADHGIAVERIEFTPWQPDAQRHFAAYGEIDIALDTAPFNGATTTCEALFMGVPVVTLVGATHPCRMGASILGAAGLAGWIARDGAQYVAKAALLAQDVDALARARVAQRERVASSPLMNHAAFARAFADAIDGAYAAIVASA